MPLALSPFQARHFNLTLIGESVGVLLAVIILIWFKKQPAAFVIPAAFGCYAIWWLLHLKSRVLRPVHRSREANHRVREFRNAIAIAKTVRIHRVESDAVVQVPHDESTICLFDVGGSQTCWIDPYFMIPGHPPKNWPNDEFEVVEIPGWKGEIGPFCSGKRLRARETIEFRDLFEHYNFEPPTDGLINQSLDAFLGDAKAQNRSAVAASVT